MIIADGKLTIVGANSGDTPYTITVNSSGVATLGPTYFTDLNVTGTLTTTAATIASLSASGASIDNILATNIVTNELIVPAYLEAENAVINVAAINMLNAPEDSVTPQFNYLNVNQLNVIETANIPNATIGQASLTNLIASSISGAPLTFEGSGDVSCEIDAYDGYQLVLKNKTKYGILEVLATTTDYSDSVAWSTLLANSNLLPDPRDATRLKTPDQYLYPAVHSWNVDINTSYQIQKWTMIYLNTSTITLPTYVWVGFKMSSDGPIISKQKFVWDNLMERGSVSFTLAGVVQGSITDDNAISVNADLFSEKMAVIINDSADSTAALKSWVGGNNITMQSWTGRGNSAAHFSESNGIWYDEPGAYRSTALPGIYFKNANT